MITRVLFTALNADNLTSNRVMYVAATGLVDIVAYIFTVVILKFVGRKVSSFVLFAFAGLCLMGLLAIDQRNTKLKFSLDRITFWKINFSF